MSRQGERHPIKFFCCSWHFPPFQTVRTGIFETQSLPECRIYHLTKRRKTEAVGQLIASMFPLPLFRPAGIRQSKPGFTSATRTNIRYPVVLLTMNCRQFTLSLSKEQAGKKQCGSAIRFENSVRRTSPKRLGRKHRPIWAWGSGGRGTQGTLTPMPLMLLKLFSIVMPMTGRLAQEHM